MSRMTEYIAIEDDNVISYFLQVLVIGMADCSECSKLVIQMDACLVIKHDTLKLHLKVWVIIASYQDLFWVMIGRIIFCPGPFMHPPRCAHLG